jgi:hypothetical protein
MKTRPIPTRRRVAIKSLKDGFLIVVVKMRGVYWVRIKLL